MGTDPIFVGRGEVLADVVEALGEGGRLVSLLGPPGIGKTRLAGRVQLEGEGESFFVDLTQARGRDEIVAAVAAAVGLQPAGPSDVVASQVRRALEARAPYLVVLDNAEGCVDDLAALLGEWIRPARPVRWLVTSRVALRVPAETKLFVPSREGPRPLTSPPPPASRATPASCERFSGYWRGFPWRSSSRQPGWRS